MEMKHFIAIHTCFSEEARRAFIDNTKDLTHRQMIEGSSFEDARLMSQWMGKDEFFYCHWVARDEDAIYGALDKIGINDIVTTLAHEMSRFVNADNVSDEKVGDPDDDS